MVINSLAKATLQTMIHTIGQKKLTRTTGRGAKVSPRVSDPKVESLVENLGDLAVANHAKAEVVVSDVASLADPSHVVLHHHTSAITIATLFGIPRCHLLPQPLHLVPRVLSATHRVHHFSPHTCPTMCQISTTQPLLHRLVLQPLTCLSGNQPAAHPSLPNLWYHHYVSTVWTTHYCAQGATGYSASSTPFPCRTPISVSSATHHRHSLRKQVLRPLLLTIALPMFNHLSLPQLQFPTKGSHLSVYQQTSTLLDNHPPKHQNRH